MTSNCNCIQGDGVRVGTRLLVDTKNSLLTHLKSDLKPKRRNVKEVGVGGHCQQETLTKLVGLWLEKV